jgi:hypothetical protein
MSQASIICSYDKYQYKAIPSTDYHNGDLEKSSSSSSFNLNISKNDNNNKNNNQLTSKPNGFTSKITVIVLIFLALLLVGLSYFWFYTSFSIVKNDITYTGEFKIKSMLYIYK